ncbi:hypothetical protein DB88DRAFT_475196 [Papiliotrema laurentii]|uniref:Uncharacterized protein n=1 Tax=Papiliotrema laurentii TaxID=5418 RepID=A0AAD9CSV7_PAPLA|nr:hypothetical protein DB88DRAFT_475196 [Papiliotrema laurentii]
MTERQQCKEGATRGSKEMSSYAKMTSWEEAKERDSSRSDLYDKNLMPAESASTNVDPTRWCVAGQSWSDPKVVFHAGTTELMHERGSFMRNEDSPVRNEVIAVRVEPLTGDLRLPTASPDYPMQRAAKADDVRRQSLKVESSGSNEGRRMTKPGGKGLGARMLRNLLERGGS